MRNVLNVDETTLFEKVKHYINEGYQSISFSIFVLILSLWALLSHDVRLAFYEKSDDFYFSAITSLVFFIFAIEILVLSALVDGYMYVPDWTCNQDDSRYERFRKFVQFGSFQFWLDTIATASLIYDIDWMHVSELDPTDSVASRASRAARAGARLGRIVQLLRVLRTALKLSEDKPVKAPVLRKRSQLLNQATELEHEQKESRIGAAMSEFKTKRVILMVLIMIIVIPFFIYVPPNNAQREALATIHLFAVKNATLPNFSHGYQLALNSAIFEQKLVRLISNGRVLYIDHSRLHSLRAQESVTYSFRDKAAAITTTGIFDVSDLSGTISLLLLYSLIVVFVILLWSSYSFKMITYNLIIHPLEHMSDLVLQISRNPLALNKTMPGPEEGFEVGYETTFLLQTLYKISGLMRVCFGEAGAGVIARNLTVMELDDKNEGRGRRKQQRLDLTGPGVMVKAIFCFYDIRNFTDSTECLQEEVMLFVNRIAHILHNVTVQCKGSVNKNVGDAFLLVWKLQDPTDELELSYEEIQDLADNALLSCCKTLILVSRHRNFICSFSVEAHLRLLSRLPDYQVRLGCGLHVGWAVEGGIGTFRKIDASYLSPHLNLVEYLEGATKTYNVSILMSEDFLSILSPQASGCCRMVDRIRRHVNELPFGIYTYDVDSRINFSLFDDDNTYEDYLSLDSDNNLSKHSSQASLVAAVNSAMRRPSPAATSNTLALKRVDEETAAAAAKSQASQLGRLKSISPSSSTLFRQRGDDLSASYHGKNSKAEEVLTASQRFVSDRNILAGRSKSMATLNQELTEKNSKSDKKGASKALEPTEAVKDFYQTFSRPVSLLFPSKKKRVVKTRDDRSFYPMVFTSVNQDASRLSIDTSLDTTYRSLPKPGYSEVGSLGPAFSVSPGLSPGIMRISSDPGRTSNMHQRSPSSMHSSHIVTDHFSMSAAIEEQDVSLQWSVSADSDDDAFSNINPDLTIQAKEQPNASLTNAENDELVDMKQTSDAQGPVADLVRQPSVTSMFQKDGPTATAEPFLKGSFDAEHVNTMPGSVFGSSFAKPFLDISPIVRHTSSPETSEGRTPVTDAVPQTEPQRSVSPSVKDPFSSINTSLLLPTSLAPFLDSPLQHVGEASKEERSDDPQLLIESLVMKMHSAEGSPGIGPTEEAMTELELLKKGEEKGKAKIKRQVSFTPSALAETCRKEVSDASENFSPSLKNVASAPNTLKLSELSLSSEISQSISEKTIGSSGSLSLATPGLLKSNSGESFGRSKPPLSTGSHNSVGGSAVRTRAEMVRSFSRTFIRTAGETNDNPRLSPPSSSNSSPSKAAMIGRLISSSFQNISSGTQNNSIESTSKVSESKIAISGTQQSSNSVFFSSNKSSGGRSVKGGRALPRAASIKCSKRVSDLRRLLESRAHVREKVPDIRVPPCDPAIWDNDLDLCRLRRAFTEGFRRCWEMAVDAYLSGDWLTAREIILSELLHPLSLQRGNSQDQPIADGPSKYLLSVMESHKWVPPADWNGFRDASNDE